MSWSVYCSDCGFVASSEDDDDEGTYSGSDPFDVAEWANEGGCPDCGAKSFEVADEAF
jgi:ribosomal protein L37E